MIVPKELYIDLFNFIPLHLEDDIDTYLCDYFNNKIEEIIIGENTNFDFRPVLQFIYYENNLKYGIIPHIDYLTKTGFLLPFILGSDILRDYNLNMYEANDICSDILMRHFKIN